MNQFILYEIPLEFASASMIAILLAAIEIGFRGGLRRYRRSRDGDPGVESTKGDITLGSLLALLGLLFAFTYAVALDRHDTRKQLVVDEANAIETAFLRADLAEEPGRTQLRRLILDYAKTRTGTTKETDTKNGLERLLAVSLEVQAKLWPLTKIVIAESELSGPIEASIITAVNDILDENARRVALVYDRMPPVVFGLLILIAALSLGIAGHNAGLHGHINRWRLAIFACVLTTLMIVIIDFEKPLSGLIHVSQTPIITTVQAIEAVLESETK